MPIWTCAIVAEVPRLPAQAFHEWRAGSPSNGLTLDHVIKSFLASEALGVVSRRPFKAEESQEISTRNKYHRVQYAAKEAGERWFPQSYPVPVYALRWYTSAPASRSLEANELFVGTFHSERAPIDQLNQPVWIEARGKWNLGSDVKGNELNVWVNGILGVQLVIVEYILLDSQTDKFGGGKCTEPTAAQKSQNANNDTGTRSVNDVNEVCIVSKEAQIRDNMPSFMVQSGWQERRGTVTQLPAVIDASSDPRYGTVKTRGISRTRAVTDGTDIVLR
ncbi:uncharacterized protein F5891DRAFT_1174955 [Suillus fuscotomentosus]|uniref:Uncharacterized protein n=1 Tax=Suillus fuscotomentosus TaxID=1912939 RepID=A0AAD4DZB1_9AGAM|nr:uncharacterized protein F5891DRAFT_1174955 [Suillus fuscotomentosus]KAG1896888.1 hypothetical protein F5891DRAFT_1174955 [Suillus fuscotomentosus]